MVFSSLYKYFLVTYHLSRCLPKLSFAFGTIFFSPKVSIRIFEPTIFHTRLVSLYVCASDAALPGGAGFDMLLSVNERLYVISLLDIWEFLFKSINGTLCLTVEMGLM